MTAEPPRPPPQSTVQAAGQAASDVISGLKSQPMLLAIVVLNLIAIVVAGWFVGKIVDNQKEAMQMLVRICFDDGRQDFGAGR